MAPSRTRHGKARLAVGLRSLGTNGKAAGSKLKPTVDVHSFCDARQNAALRTDATPARPGREASRCFTRCAWNSCLTAASHATLRGNNSTKQQMDSERLQAFDLN